MSILDTSQTMTIAMARSFRNVRAKLRSGMTALTGFSAYVPKHITIAPKDLRTVDPIVAEEFYRGRYILAGSLIETGGGSPFLIENADIGWKEELHSFAWLRHLATGEDAMSASRARAVVADWIENGSLNEQGPIWKHDVASRRLISLLCHSDVILNQAEYEFYQQFMRCLGSHVRFLKRHAPAISDGYTRALAYIALSYASVCHDNQLNSLAFARERMGRELDQQILSDGGHVSRNPTAIVEILSLLLPLRQACVTAGVEVSSQVSSAIERMLPALKFFRMGDGSIARFNGAGEVPRDLLVTLLRYDESLGSPLSHAVQSGYQRQALGDAVVLSDMGNPPKGELSVGAHAGCLSFEFSSGLDCIIVNCGTPGKKVEGSVNFWRSSAAHSTAVFTETSSCRFENIKTDGAGLSGQILGYSLKAESTRKDTEHGSVVMGSHLGYAREFGARHERILTLDKGGNRLQGHDAFTAPDETELRYSTRDRVAVRFHLHPEVKVAKSAEKENTCLLVTRSGIKWQFSCVEVEPGIEESIFFATSSGASRKARQLVLHFNASNLSKVNWSIQCLD